MNLLCLVLVGAAIGLGVLARRAYRTKQDRTHTGRKPE